MPSACVAPEWIDDARSGCETLVVADPARAAAFATCASLPRYSLGWIKRSASNRLMPAKPRAVTGRPRQKLSNSAVSSVKYVTLTSPEESTASYG